MKSEKTQVRKKLSEAYGEDLLFADGFDDAIIGISIAFDAGRVVYDTGKMVDILAQEENFTKEVAWEYLEFNTFSSYVGEQTPIYVGEIYDDC